MTELLKRKFEAEATVGDGRTIDLRMVPYGEPAWVDDGDGPYQEEFVRGAFDGQLEFAHRVYLNFDHAKGIGNIVGKGIKLEEREDALYGEFRALEHSDGDKALALVREGVLTGASIEFKPKKGGSIRTAEGIVRRIKAHLDAVALCRVGAYAGAGVVSVRDEADEEDEHHIIDGTLIPHDLDPELVERLRAQNISLPDRYTAHPAQGTPEASGTPSDDTRQTGATTSSEE